MFGNVKTLPEPVGGYNVGITYSDFIDDTRSELFEFAKGESRVIPARIYYPAEGQEGKQPAPYVFLEEARAARKFSAGLIPLKSLMNIRTHCYPDLKLSGRIERFPVIFFNHGYFSYSSQNTVLCADLASKGYIVVSLGHPYESGAVKSQSGHAYIHRQELYDGFKQTMSKETKAKFKAIDEQTYSDDEIGPAVKDFYEGLKHTSVWKNVKIWADDTRFAADQLYKWNGGSIPSMFRGRLALELGFGITGHSYGGCTAAQVCLEDNRFVCGVNLDAPTYGDYWDQDLRKPFMTLGSHIIENASRTVYVNNSADSYFILADNTEHMDYTDYLLLARQMKLAKLLGKNDIRRAHEIREMISAYHIEFFDKYVRRERQADLQRHRFSGVSVRVR